MATELKPIRTKADHKVALAEVFGGLQSAVGPGSIGDACPQCPPAERAPYPSSVRAVSRPLASAASTVPISLPR
jgi:hypothetical protein